MAPEKLLGKPHDESIDVYSFGLILWEVCNYSLCHVTVQLYSRHRAFEAYLRGSSLPAFITAVCERDERPIVPPECPPQLSFLIKYCWSKVPRDRPR